MNRQWGYYAGFIKKKKQENNTTEHFEIIKGAYKFRM